MSPLFLFYPECCTSLFDAEYNAGIHTKMLSLTSLWLLNSTEIAYLLLLLGFSYCYPPVKKLAFNSLGVTFGDYLCGVMFGYGIDP